MSDQPRFAFEDAPLEETADARARRLAVDPTRNVALEASAGTGKTRVLVDRYVRLLEAGVAPRNILAITFTRKAAAEMRQRVMATLILRHREGAIAGQRWRDLRDAMSAIAISTIDAFCLALLHEFPLEAGVAPGFDLADETETPRLVDRALDRALRVGRAQALESPEVELVFAELGEARLRQGLAALLDRRLVAGDALNRFVRGREVDVATACANLLAALRAGLASMPGGPAALTTSGPDDPGFAVVARDVERVLRDPPPPPALLRGALDRLAAHVLTRDGSTRKRLAHTKAAFRSAADYDRHKAAVLALGPHVEAAVEGLRRDLNLVLARGVRRLFNIALDDYRRLLDEQGVLDFTDLLERTLRLLGQMDEFSRSRYRLESRYEHVLVDEFQDTSRAQWQLVQELVRAWAAGEGLSHGPLPPSIFIVGDRKQSIYGFRDAEVTVLDAAARYIDALRPDAPARAAITRSYRSVRELLAFVNDVCADIEKQPDRADAFRYDETDAFPMLPDAARGEDAVGLAVAATDEAQAELVAGEIARLLVEGATVRDRQSGVRRPIAPGDVGILFRTREGHAQFEAALARHGVPFYVYKGLGFFDADEVKDVLALVGYLADPASNLRAAALMRSRFIRVSDEALKILAPRLAAALSAPDEPGEVARLAPVDQERLRLARGSLGGWVAMADQLPPAELIDRVLAESGYAVELGGPGFEQARENLKKLRGLVRRIQNRGYATLGRLVEYFAELVAGGDESNAIIDAADAVNLMTVHAAKGLEFPVVFLVNLGKGSGGSRAPIRVVAPPVALEGEDEAPASVAVGDHLNEADHDADAREQEEAKRLLYVALTRARDRVYLGGTVTNGKVSLGKGALGRMLPAGLLALMAAPGGDAVALWSGATAQHRVRRVVPPDTPAVWQPSRHTVTRHDDFAALPPSGSRRVPVTLAAGDAASAADATGGGSTARAGAIAHAAIARALQRGGDDEAALARDVETLAGAPLDEPGDARRALDLARAVLRAPDLGALVGSGRAAFEVPVSLAGADETIARGVVDCVVVGTDTVTVVEFKTGAPQPAHQRQLDLYVRAVAALYRDRRVEGRLVYGGENSEDAGRFTLRCPIGIPYNRRDPGGSRSPKTCH